MLHQLPLFAAIGAALVAAPPAAPAQGVAGTLDSIARVAVARNLAVKRASERQREAEAGVRQATGLLVPSLAIDSRYSQFDGVVNIGDFINPAYAALNQLTGKNQFPTNISSTLPFKQESHLRTQVPLFNGAIFANLTGARAIRTLRGAERAAAIRRLDAEVRLAWLGWARAARGVDTWDAAIVTLRENLRVAQRLVDAGAGTPDAVLRARAALADAEQQRGEAARLRDAARGTVNAMLDQEIDAPLTMPAADGLPEPPAITLEAALTSALRREERTMATAAVDGARGQGLAASSAFLPSVAVAADYGLQGDRYRFDRNHDVATASIVLQWNLFSGGQDAARREAATAARRGAELQGAEIDRQIALDVRTAWDAVQAAKQAVAAADARLTAARSAFTLVDRRYGEGVASHLEWSDARTQLTAAELNQTITTYLLAARGIELERAAALRPLPKD
jgi:outer membrane protein TolC